MPYPDAKKGWKKAMDDIRKQNQIKKERIKDSKIPKPLKTALEFEDGVATLPKTKRKNRRRK